MTEPAPQIALSVDELLTTTRNVRKRLDLQRPVPRQIIEECLDLAVQAPNGSNHQSWEWVVIDDPDVRAHLGDLSLECYREYAETMAARPEVYERFDVGRNDRRPQISNAAPYLFEHLAQVPVLVIPTVLGRTERADIFVQASTWGSILPAARIWQSVQALDVRAVVALAAGKGLDR